MRTVQTQSELERKKNGLIASLFRRDYPGAEKRFRRIWEAIRLVSDFSENDQKVMNQIHQLLRKFRGEIRENRLDGLMETRRLTRRKMAEAARKQLRNVEYVEYDDWKDRLGVSEDRLGLVLRTTATLQLTVGCANCCRRCNEWALPGVRKHFSRDAVLRFTRELFEKGNRGFAYYGASDPLDWVHDGADFTDVLTFMRKNGYEQEFGILTKIPAGSERAARKLIEMNADFAVSVTKRNRAKVEALEEATGRKLSLQHDVEELLTPAGLDEDFTSIKSSITDNYGAEITPDGAFMIVPTFTSALNPTGQRRIPVTSETDFFLEKKVGWEALSVEYFKPLKAIDPGGERFTLEGLLDPQVENILQDDGSGDPTPPGMMNFREHLNTYEPEIVRNRKKLAPSVIRELRSKYAGNGADDEALFRKKARLYEDSCDIGKVSRSKKYAFSFYLGAVSDYLASHPSEREIILRLRAGDGKRYTPGFPSFSRKHDHDVERMLSSSSTGAFDLFEMLMFRLLDAPRDQSILHFIKSNPAVYDPESDRFRRGAHHSLSYNSG